MQNRLNRLESIVANLMTETPNSVPPAKALNGVSPTNAPEALQPMQNGIIASEKEQELADASKSFGVLRIEDDRFLYRGSTHWDDVLHEVSCSN